MFDDESADACPVSLGFFESEPVERRRRSREHLAVVTGGTCVQAFPPGFVLSLFSGPLFADEASSPG